MQNTQSGDFGNWFGGLLLVGMFLGIAWAFSQAAQEIFRQLPPPPPLPKLPPPRI